ncbi:MAG TPA: c-type cytochrome [Burkholderiaceae bacterium]|jgi:cytochrome c5|nr:c-type cytochrome [Burkholderiaceae bacterium]
MSEEQHHEEAEHESGIKTPKQLIIVVVAAIVVPVIVIIMLTQFVSLDNKRSPGSEALSASAVAARIAPVASDAVFDANAVVVTKTGQQVFEAQCTTCHTAGLLGAPKFGDAAAWGPRVGKGYDALLQSALHGKGNMPAQGGGDFSDFEVGRAVVYMANHGGGKLAEPAAPAASAAASGASAAAASAAASAASK